MATSSALLGLWAETSIHAGTGSSVDGIDLPIQREGHNGWPCVFGSAVKGALRAKAEDSWGKKDDAVRFVFGPDSQSSQASEHAGALMVGDARLLLLPVRSLTGHFKWVTCPALLERLKRDAKRLGKEINYSDIPVETETAVQFKLSNNDLFLEEYRLKVKDEPKLNEIITVLSALSGIEAKLLNEQLVLVDNSMFSYLSQYTTPVTAHIAIDNEKKIVKKGALWYEETLPPETVFYLALNASRVRDSNADYKQQEIINDKEANSVLRTITENLFKESPYLQIGGNETLGMGWCKVQEYKGA